MLNTIDPYSNHFVWFALVLGLTSLVGSVWLDPWPENVFNSVGLPKRSGTIMTIMSNTFCCVARIMLCVRLVYIYQPRWHCGGEAACSVHLRRFNNLFQRFWDDASLKFQDMLPIY